MKSSVLKLSRIGLIATATVVWGCSSLPNAPEVGTGPRGATPNMESNATSSSTSSSLPISTVIDGRRGGSLTVGDFSVIVPKGAYGGPATITITVVNPSVKQCDLSIDPVSYNNFKYPVTLSVNMGTSTEAQASSMYWWDPAAAVWTTIPSTASKTKRNAPLSHFSQYKCGRAGW